METAEAMSMGHEGSYYAKSLSRPGAHRSYSRRSDEACGKLLLRLVMCRFLALHCKNQILILSCNVVLRQIIEPPPGIAERIKMFDLLMKTRQNHGLELIINIDRVDNAPWHMMSFRRIGSAYHR